MSETGMVRCDQSRSALGAALRLLAAAACLLSQLPATGQPIVKTQDIVYRNVEDVELKLDVSAPPQAVHRPAIVFLCGNGYGHYRHNRRQFWDAMDAAAARGYVGVSVDYSSAATKKGEAVRFPFPAQVLDVKCAVRWLRANAAAYGIDPERIGVVGWSSGGTLALMLALTGPSDGLEGGDENAAYSSAVRVAVAFGADSDFELYYMARNLTWDVREYLDGPEGLLLERCRRASPVAYVRPGVPPILLVHGDGDREVPLSQSETLAARLEAAGCPHELVVRRGEGHRIFMHEPKVWPFLAAALSP